MPHSDSGLSIAESSPRTTLGRALASKPSVFLRFGRTIAPREVADRRGRPCKVRAACRAGMRRISTAQVNKLEKSQREGLVIRTAHGNIPRVGVAPRAAGANPQGPRP